MTSKIFRSIFLVAMCILAACFVMIISILNTYFTGVEEAQMENSLQFSALGVEQGGLSYLQGLDENCRLTWVDADGTVLYDTRSDVTQMENHAQREEIQEALTTGKGSSVRYSETRTEKTIYRAVRLSDGTVLRTSISQATVLYLVLGMLQTIAVILVAALAISMLLAYKLTNNIMSPLRNLDMDRLPDTPPYPELEPLLQKIKGQKQEIDKQKKELADKRLSMEFAEQNRREFTANVSHELKTPLQSIMGSAELIENGMVKPEDLSRFAGKIRKESHRLLTLIEDIIHLSWLDEDEPLRMEPVDLYAAAEEEIASLRPIASENNIQLNLLGETAVIQGIPQLVREIIHNLCDNGVKYNRNGGKVTVRISETEEKVLLSVSDTGIGIPQAHQSRIFERFYRVDKSRSKATGGTGLGLSIVKHAASYMNADITLESALGVGTTITVKFKK